MNAKNTKPGKLTAAQVYATRRRDIDQLLAALNQRLAEFDARAHAAPLDWGFAGSLGTVRRDLVEIVAGLGNQDPEDLERALFDGR